MKIQLIIAFILCHLGCWSQSQQKSIFSDIKTAQKSLPHKYTVVYTYVTWCGGNADDIESIYPVLSEFRSKYNFIVLVDSSKQSKTSRFILDLKPDGYVFLNGYYPSCFIKKKEYKKYAKDFNDQFKTSEVYLGPGSSYILDCNTNLIKILNDPDRIEELKSILTAIPENCP